MKAAGLFDVVLKYGFLVCMRCELKMADVTLAPCPGWRPAWLPAQNDLARASVRFRNPLAMRPTMKISNNSSFVPRSGFHSDGDEPAGPDSRTLVKLFWSKSGKRLKGEYNLCKAVALTPKKQMI